jgi:hypothetical protein
LYTTVAMVPIPPVAEKTSGEKEHGCLLNTLLYSKLVTLCQALKLDSPHSAEHDNYCNAYILKDGLDFYPSSPHHSILHVCLYTVDREIFAGKIFRSLKVSRSLSFVAYTSVRNT